jgi:ABC-2 type transport system ATP-binding protein
MSDHGGIDVDAVTRSFGGVHAVRGMTFHARPGAVTGLVGPNGSGKTTLLLILATLLRPDSGRVRVAGIDPTSAPRTARPLIGWMPDTLGAWPSLTASETLVTTARMYGMSRPAANVRARELLTQVGLTELARSRARVLSRGQKQRLGLARALVHDPPVLLLDEPASGLDPQARVALRTMLRGFAAEGRTVLVSSHVLSELEEVVDDAVFVAEGRTFSSERIDAARATSRAWRVRLTANAPMTDAVVARIAHVVGRPLTNDRGEALVSFDSESAAADALQRLVRADIPVVEFAPATGDLEHTLLDLGGDGRRESDEANPDAAPPGPASGGPA